MNADDSVSTLALPCGDSGTRTHVTGTRAHVAVSGLPVVQGSAETAKPTQQRTPVHKTLASAASLAADLQTLRVHDKGKDNSADHSDSCNNGSSGGMRVHGAKKLPRLASR